jgi:hypothetical protein
VKYEVAQVERVPGFIYRGMRLSPQSAAGEKIDSFDPYVKRCLSPAGGIGIFRQCG